MYLDIHNHKFIYFGTEGVCSYKHSA
jgi:hypothetical protein